MLSAGDDTASAFGGALIVLEIVALGFAAPELLALSTGVSANAAYGCPSGA
jgi:hypothetical protein